MRLRLTTIVLLLAAGCGNVASEDAVSPGPPDDGDTDGAVQMSRDIPEPITPEDMAVMDLADAQEAYRHLSQALQQSGWDEATKKRLWDEWRLVRNRVRELKKSDGS